MKGKKRVGWVKRYGVTKMHLQYCRVADEAMDENIGDQGLASCRGWGRFGTGETPEAVAACLKRGRQRPQGNLEKLHAHLTFLSTYLHAS